MSNSNKMSVNDELGAAIKKIIQLQKEIILLQKDLMNSKQIKVVNISDIGIDREN